MPFSTDFGNVSRQVPAAMIGFSRPGPDAWAVHLDQGEQQFLSGEGETLALTMSAALAVAADRLTDPPTPDPHHGRTSPMPPGEWAIVNALVMDAKGGFVRRPSVGTSAGLFTDFNAERPGRDVLDARGLWLIPGVYDCHTHISWNDFHLEDRDRREPAERAQLTAASVAATLRGGVTSARDAGGADAGLRDAVAGGRLPGPRRVAL